MKKILVLAAAGAAALISSAPAAAQATGANPRAVANARLIKPLTLTALRNLDFGTVVMGTLTANEQVSISGAGAVTCGSSGNLSCSGSAQSAQFRVTGTQGQVVTVSSSAASFTLNGSNGGTLSFVPSLPGAITLGNSGSPGNDFTVGGSITVGPATIDGLYQGQVDIQVAYQ